MNFQQSSLQIQDVIPGEQYRYALTNFRIAHEKVEEQRTQLEEQERQVAQLRSRIALLEGSGPGSVVSQASASQSRGANTVDDFSIKNAASQLEKIINRWASDIVRSPPIPLDELCEAILSDLATSPDVAPYEGTSMQVQSLLRHAMSETISEGIINCLIVTNSIEANVQLTRIHEHIFARDPTVACVWRRQTFSAAVESCSPSMTSNILYEHIPSLMNALGGTIPTSGTPNGNTSILDSAYDFSRMLHGSNVTTGDAFYRAFVPELGSTLYPGQIELVKRCLRSESGDIDRVGATVFPGLVKVTRGPVLEEGQNRENVQTVVRRAQVICECALTRNTAAAAQKPLLNGQTPPPPPL